MPKNEIDYSNTIIYKIYCKDSSINDIYVGHTTNFTKRKSLHKTCCNNLNNKCKIYNIIRENGGWENWDMIELAKYNCKDKTEALIKEQEHYELLKCSLNSCLPFFDINKYFCKTCNLHCKTSKIYKKHIISHLHIKKEKDLSEKYKKLQYTCKLCNFECSKLSNYNTHILTLKHKNRTNLNILEQNKNDNFNCKYCNKTYNARNSLWYHEKKCTQSAFNAKKNASDDVNNVNDKELIMSLLQQNNQLQNHIIELFKNNSNTIFLKK